MLEPVADVIALIPGVESVRDGVQFTEVLFPRQWERSLVQLADIQVQVDEAICAALHQVYLLEGHIVGDAELG